MSSITTIERVFDAPRSLVWKAFTDPDQFAQWFGPVGYSVRRDSVQLDTHVGGVRRYAMAPNDPSFPPAGEIVGTVGEFIEEQLILTFADVDGELAELFGATHIELRLEFHDADGDGTRLVIQHGPYRDDFLGNVRAGWIQSFTKLDRLLGGSPGKVRVFARGELEIVISRTFAAPAQAVWDAWTDPEQIRQWWPGLRGIATSIEMDLRVGGAWRFVMETNDGTEIAFHGECLEIDAPRLLRSTEVFEMMPDFPTENTMTLTEDGQGSTRLEVVVVASNPQARDMQLGSGMEGGITEGFEILERLARAGQV